MKKAVFNPAGNPAYNPAGLPKYRGGGSVAVVTPLTIVPSATAWWRADMDTTIATGVTLWEDQANGYTMDKLNTSEQPTLTTSSNFGGKAVLDFNAAATQGMDADNFVDCTTDKATIWMVMEHDTAAVTRYFCEWSPGVVSNDGPSLLSVSSGTIRARLKNSANTWISANWTRATNFTATILELSYNGTGGAGNISLYEGTTQRANATDTTGGLNSTLGEFFCMQAANDTFHSDGKVAEVLVWDDTLSTAQRSELKDYANARYGLSVA
jgi:hypothetical protein